MPLSFLFALVACYAVVFVSLVTIHWYSSAIIGTVCLCQYLWALKIACADKERRFPFAAFVFSGAFYLVMPGQFSETLSARAIWVLQNALHPPLGASEKPVLFSARMGYFSDVATIGIALIVSTLVFYAVSMCERNTLRHMLDRHRSPL